MTLEGHDIRRICRETREVFKRSVAACACCDEMELRLLAVIGEDTDPEGPPDDQGIETV